MLFILNPCSFVCYLSNHPMTENPDMLCDIFKLKVDLPAIIKYELKITVPVA